MMDAILNWCDNLLENDIWFYLITTVIKLVLMFAVILAFVVLSVWIERRVAGWIQDRPGPNRAGIPLTLFQRFGSKEKQPLKKVLHYFGIPETCWIAKLCTWLKLDRDIPTMSISPQQVEAEEANGTTAAATMGGPSTSMGAMVK